MRNDGREVRSGWLVESQEVSIIWAILGHFLKYGFIIIWILQEDFSWPTSVLQMDYTTLSLFYVLYLCDRLVDNPGENIK